MDLGPMSMTFPNQEMQDRGKIMIGEDGPRRWEQPKSPQLTSCLNATWTLFLMTTNILWWTKRKKEMMKWLAVGAGMTVTSSLTKQEETSPTRAKICMTWLKLYMCGNLWRRKTGWRKTRGRLANLEEERGKNSPCLLWCPLIIGLGLGFLKTWGKSFVMQVPMYFSIFSIRWILIWLTLMWPWDSSTSHWYSWSHGACQAKIENNEDRMALKNQRGSH